jgi:hypothetical protein
MQITQNLILYPRFFDHSNAKYYPVNEPGIFTDEDEAGRILQLSNHDSKCLVSSWADIYFRTRKRHFVAPVVRKPNSYSYQFCNVFGWKRNQTG